MEVTMNDILYAVLTVAVPLVLRYLYQLVAQKVANTRYAKAVDACYSAVDYVNQTFVDALKQSGSFDEQAAAQALRKAKDAALEVMDKGTRNWLSSAYMNLDEWLTVQIEGAVKNRKAGEGSASD